MQVSPNPEYEVVEKPCNTFLDLDLVKKHLEVTFGDTTNDFYIQSLIKAVVQFFELNTNTILLTTTFRLYLDFFPPVIEVRRKPNVTTTSIEYFKDDVLTVVDALTYYQLFSSRYPKILPVADSDWPTDADDRLQVVQVNFTAGYGATFDNVPADIVNALMQQIANMYENRGDCSDFDSGMSKSVRAVYTAYTVHDITIGC